MIARAVIFWAAMLGFVAGCTLQNVDSGYRLENDASEGLVVFAVTRSGLEEFTIFARVRGNNGAVDTTIQLPSVTDAFDWQERCATQRGTSIELDDCYGRLHVVELPAGHYEFYETVAEGAQVHGYDRVRVRWSRMRSASFEAKAGRAVYAGNIYFAFEYNDSPRQYRLFLVNRDSYDRDLGLFKARYTNIRPDQIDRASEGFVIERRGG